MLNCRDGNRDPLITHLKFLPQQFKEWAREFIQRKYPTVSPSARMFQLGQCLKYHRHCHLTAAEKALMYEVLPEGEANHLEELINNNIKRDVMRGLWGHPSK